MSVIRLTGTVGALLDTVNPLVSDPQQRVVYILEPGSASYTWDGENWQPHEMRSGPTAMNPGVFGAL
jgi:hypothetical protein